MARFDAIAAVASAISGVLDTAAAAEFEETITVKPLTPAGLSANLQDGALIVGLWLYAVSPNAQRRSMVRPRIGEPARLPSTAVDLHFLLIARAADALMQQRLLGWGIRTIEDHASLPPSVLNNGAFVGCFQDDETVAADA